MSWQEPGCPPVLLQAECRCGWEQVDLLGCVGRCLNWVLAQPPTWVRPSRWAVPGGFWAGHCPQAGQSLPRDGNTLQCATPASVACGPRSPIPVSYLDICGGLLGHVSLSEPPPSGGSVAYHGARGGLERLASPLFRALQSSQRCPSTDHSLCCLEGWTTRLGAAAQKLCFPRVRPALVLTPALPPRSRILTRSPGSEFVRQ